ncbi:hypothetical protein C2L64_45675 [Paraburkholderia hospita]|uniref:DUF3331 domain-containing protein n=2 Tax=Paraburkholderia hospita TaxID=169430 RepID=A0AAN1MR70_9BURK|nr:hypothetical protein C2L64_45675 [Paraburkholderia hospita]
MLEESRIRREGCGSLREKPVVVPDGSRAPVWDHVISMLHSGDSYEGANEAHIARSSCRLAAYVPSPHIQVEIIERLSESSIAVLWQDATRCRYVDQVWIGCRARMQGRCALSDATIRRGDLIFKPKVRSALPANANAMILASVIAQILAKAAKGG